MPSSASPSSQRILSLWFSRLPTDRVARLSRNAGAASVQPGAAGAPLVVIGKRKSAERVLALDAAAEARGLRRGTTLAEARAMHPDMVVADEDAEADARLLRELAEWAGRYTPLVALDPPDGLLLDITGCTHLYGGEASLLHDLTQRVARLGFALRATVASTAGAAWAVSRYGERTIVAAGDERAALAPLPVAALRLSCATADALARLGLARIRDLAGLPRAPLAARFTSEVQRQLDRATGREREPLSPLLPVAPYLAEQRFAEPITHEDAVLQAVERLARRLVAMLEKRGEGARRIELRLFRTDGAVRCLAVGASRPLRDAHAIRALFVERLAALADALDPGFGFDLARLAILAAEPFAAAQPAFGEGAGAGDAVAFAQLVDRLSARLGPRRVLRTLAQESHVPELAAIERPAQQMLDGDAGWEAYAAYRDKVGLAPRPLRLLLKPEPIEAVAGVPDGPPVRFRWRRALHEVVAAEGPERIETPWWNEGSGPARDYFRVEDSKGLRFWLFRAGLYRDGAEPRWFMHGLFA